MTKDRPKDLVPAVSIPQTFPSVRLTRGELPGLLLIAAQLALVVLVIREYQLESRTLYHIALLITGGFVVHGLLPLAYRLPFFVLLSLGGIIVTFGLQEGATLVAAGVALIGLCHLPIHFHLRIALLALVGGLFAAARGGVIPSPLSAAVWPILGSMFMFRLALYLYAIRHDKLAPTPAWALAYFFMLPNTVFPLYPVVDYSTFTRSHYDRDAFSIYQTGVRWIVRGLVHLLLYRAVYQFAVLDVADVRDLGDLTQFLLSTFLLYLRVSGSFHLIVGVLHLFGFRLPETHHLYYLASSFTDFWRRINIYWKDFMMKLVYYPSFFRLRRHGNTRAVVVSTLIVFAATWVLHSYQWFWLRGGFPLTAQDALFWAILGALVVRTALRELKKGRDRTAGRRGWDRSLAIRTVGTFTAICVLWSLWSAESLIGWIWMWRAALNVNAYDLLLLGALLGFGFAVGGRSWDSDNQTEERAQRPRWREAAASFALLAGLLAFAQTNTYDATAPRVAGMVATLQSPMLNDRDAELQNRGYYENLDNPSRLSAQLWGASAAKPADWQPIGQIGLVRQRPREFIGWDLHPDLTTSQNGKVITTNRWGMRDQDYAIEKSPGSIRIAVLGQSHVMGAHVADDEVFDNVLEDRLNQELGSGRGVRFEVLNFGVANYSLSQQLALLESRVLGFDPDIVIFTVASVSLRRETLHLVDVITNGVEIPYRELEQRLATAGLLEGDQTGVPIPFKPARSVARAVGIDARIPYDEVRARALDLTDEVTTWVMQMSAQLIREKGAEPVLMALGTVDDPESASLPQEAAVRAGFRVWDLSDVYEGYDGSELSVAPWDTHPNARAHRLIADRLYEKIVSDDGLLTSASGASVAAAP